MWISLFWTWEDGIRKYKYGIWKCKCPILKMWIWRHESDKLQEKHQFDRTWQTMLDGQMSNKDRTFMISENEIFKFEICAILHYRGFLYYGNAFLWSRFCFQFQSVVFPSNTIVCSSVCVWFYDLCINLYLYLCGIWRPALCIQAVVLSCVWESLRIDSRPSFHIPTQYIRYIHHHLG